MFCVSSCSSVHLLPRIPWMPIKLNCTETMLRCGGVGSEVLCGCSSSTEIQYQYLCCAQSSSSSSECVVRSWHFSEDRLHTTPITCVYAHKRFSTMQRNSLHVWSDLIRRFFQGKKKVWIVLSQYKSRPCSAAHIDVRTVGLLKPLIWLITG